MLKAAHGKRVRQGLRWWHAVANRTVVLVAPYSPGGTSQHLGAAKKIEMVASLLRKLHFEVHLVDSSHAQLAFASPTLGARHRLDDQDITLWRPFSLPSRKLGKLLNVYLSGSLFKRIAALDPALVWLYNSYAFEARLGLYLRQRTACKLVFELEDLPRARARGLNPKPLLDQMYFNKLLQQADLITFVNAALRTRFAAQMRGKALLFPSILKNELTAAPARARFGGSVHYLGYFGGLESDKGVGILLELLSRLPEPWHLIVTGAGSLDAEFRAAQTKFPSKLSFHGRVSHARVAELMHQCDAIVNPHASIAHMRDGVFPFKVSEAIASGALLISTALPPIDIDLSRSVCFFDGSSDGLVAALHDARQLHNSQREHILRVREEICQRYSEEAVLRDLSEAIAKLFNAHTHPYSQPLTQPR